MKIFSSIERGKSFFQNEAEFMRDVDELFDIFFLTTSTEDNLKNNPYFEWQTKISNSFLTKKDHG